MGENSRTRSAMAALFCAAFVFAVGLSVSPQLHDWLHKSGDQPAHQCAATILSSGGVEHSACEPALVQPSRLARGSILPAVGFPRLRASLPFSLLEHAPPAHS